MTQNQTWQSIQDIFNKIGGSFLNVSTITVFIIALLLAYVVSHLLASIIRIIARAISQAGDAAENPEQRLRYRRLETFISIGLALMRFAVFALAVFIAWEYTHPNSAPAAIVASGTIFIVMAGATIVPMLRDLTAGTIMIAEKWYNVGDFITIEPFTISGVVERMNLRSTKIRSLTGEVVWVHNQNIQAAKITPNGLRTIAIDVFVSNLEKGRSLIEEVSSTLPVEPTMLAAPLKVVDVAKLDTRLWQITALSKVTPGREWLLENFAREAIEQRDKKTDKIIKYGPIVYNADQTAEKRFRRALHLQSPDRTITPKKSTKSPKQP